jgi:hypothetical protein
MALLDEGWSVEQAQAILDKLMVREGIPDWKPQHLRRFQEWCAAKGKNKNAIDSQLEFVAHDLCNEHETIGVELKLATTVEEARVAVEPYVSELREEGDWYRQPYRRRV